ncbi:MAG: dihydroorotate dehydrogenase [Proteobacteria bacterium]|nr:dihydroorotate dehydrogenase [Pseudomonadota bacterium]
MNQGLNLSVDIGGNIILKNPVMTASGTFGYAGEFHRYMDLNKLGGIVVKGLSLNPSKGNPPPRIVETSCGMLNAIGLENVGIDAFQKEKLPFLRTLDTKIFANIYGKTIDEYARLAAIIENLDGMAGVEINISCPNVSAGGLAFGVDPSAAAHVVKKVRQETKKHVMVKLSPNVTDVTEIALSVENAGADSISLINTITGMAIDADTRKPKLANIIGGLSGPAIKPVALRMVWQTAAKVKIPVIGIGGIMTARDAIEFLIAGASAIQVGTASFINPKASEEIVDGIMLFMQEKGISDVCDLIGSIELPSR